MRVKIRGRRLEFDPESIEWRHQSSQQTRFGMWKSESGPVFVKKFGTRPTGWRLLQELKGAKLHNSPEILALHDSGNVFYAFFEWLDGEILSRVLQGERRADFLGAAPLGPDQKLRLFISVYGFITHLHERGFWYPDLDFKNIFISHPGPEFQVHLIDLDSCIGFNQPADPHAVSQKFWEGLIRTYQEAGKPFLKKGLNGQIEGIQAHGLALNQSMLLLLAYALHRLGTVPPEAPLFAPLINPQNPVSSEVKRLHSRWLTDQDCRRELESWLADYFRIPLNTFRQEMARLSPQPRSGIGAFISRIFGS